MIKKSDKSDVDIILEAYHDMFDISSEDNEEIADNIEIENDTDPGEDENIETDTTVSTDEDEEKYEKSSFLRKSIEQIFEIKDLQKAADFFKEKVKQSRINNQNKSKIISNIEKIAATKDITSLWAYAVNCMFKYEGKGL